MVFVLNGSLPAGWQEVLFPLLSTIWFGELDAFVRAEYLSSTVYPAKEHIFAALEHTPFADVQVVILGQDPYHRPGQAHGLSFSVPEGVRLPPSLRNIFKERAADVEIPISTHGNLVSWARQGVLLLNTVLTVREGQPLSHRGMGWERFTDEILLSLASCNRPIVFVLWGNDAKRRKTLLTNSNHFLLEAAHPSPLSAHAGFFGSRPFSQTNAFLAHHGVKPIDWGS